MGRGVFNVVTIVVMVIFVTVERREAVIVWQFGLGLGNKTTRLALGKRLWFVLK